MTNNPNPTPAPTLSNQAYNVLKFIALVLLPALGTLYFAVAGIWGLPAAEQVVGTIVAVDTFLGVVLGLSSNNFKKNLVAGTGDAPPPATDGILHIDTMDPLKDIYQFEIGTPLDEVATKDTITLKVKARTGVLTDELDPKSDGSPTE